MNNNYQIQRSRHTTFNNEQNNLPRSGQMNDQK